MTISSSSSLRAIGTMQLEPRAIRISLADTLLTAEILVHITSIVRNMITPAVTLHIDLSQRGRATWQRHPVAVPEAELAQLIDAITAPRSRVRSLNLQGIALTTEQQNALNAANIPVLNIMSTTIIPVHLRIGW